MFHLTAQDQRAIYASIAILYFPLTINKPAHNAVFGLGRYIQHQAQSVGRVLTPSGGFQASCLKAGECLGRFAACAVNPFYHLMMAERTNCQLESYAAQALNNYREKEHPGWADFFMASLKAAPIALYVRLERLIAKEITGLCNITNFADHLGQMGCNPIPQNYYYMSDCFRYGSFYLGNDHVKPYTTTENIIAIKGRSAVLTFLYNLS